MINTNRNMTRENQNEWNKKFKEDSLLKNISIILFKIGLSGLKSFVFALSQVVWVFAGFMIISATIIYLIKSGDIKTLTEIPKGLVILIEFFRNYWGWFFLAIWIYDFIINFNEINKI